MRVGLDILNAVLRELRAELHTVAPTVSGRTLGENIEIGRLFLETVTGADLRPGVTMMRRRPDPSRCERRIA